MKRRSGWNIMGRLVGLVKPLTGYMCLAILMGLIGHLFASFITILGGYAILYYLNEPIILSIGMIFAGVCVFAVLRAVLRYGEQSCNHFIAFTLLAIIRDKVFQTLRRLCPAKLECKDKGNLISLITSDVELLEVFYAHTISPIAIAILFCILMCLYIGSFHWALALVALAAYVTVGLIIPLVVSKFSGNNGMEFRTKAGALSGYVLDSLRGLNETIQYGDGQARMDAMNAQSDALSAEEHKMKKMAGRNTAMTNTIILFFDLAMLFTSALLYQNGAVSFAGVLLPTLAMLSSFGPCVALAGLGSTLQNTFAAGNRVLDILDESPVVEDITGKKEIPFQGAKAQDVSFAYDREQILDHVSVDIPKGSVVGIVGRSGSGKSTLLKLLMRFWNVQEGSVSISDTPIDQINTDNLRNMESYVTQDTHLFKDSIKSNLRIAKLDATDEELIAACKKASVHDFIMTLPQQYDTPVGELGDTLSGGERQRIGLARAFLHDVPFILLDEPTSNLDSLNEAVILKSLHEERENKTVVLVSHRESTMKIADRVYSVENGRMS